MKIQYCSDFHVDENLSYRIKKKVRPVLNADVVVVAGDLAHGLYYGIDNIPKEIEQRDLIIKKVKSMMSYLETKWSNFVYCYGNHDFYYGTLPLDYFGHVKKIGNQTFICSPLFSKLSYLEALDESLKPTCYRFVDFQWIKGQDGKNLTPVEYSQYHEKCVKWIGEQLDMIDGKAVVVTHHMPMMQCIAQKYKNYGRNYLYASDLSEFIEMYSNKIALWICGHSHDSMVVEHCGVKIIRSPVGYMEYNESSKYSNKSIEIDDV